MQLFLSLLAFIAVASLLVIASSAVTLAAAVERHRIEKQKQMESHWTFPTPEPPEPPLPPSSCDPGFAIEAPDWRKQMPALTAG